MTMMIILLMFGLILFCSGIIIVLLLCLRKQLNGGEPVDLKEFVSSIKDDKK